MQPLTTSAIGLVVRHLAVHVVEYGSSLRVGAYVLLFASILLIVHASLVRNTPILCLINRPGLPNVCDYLQCMVARLRACTGIYDT